MTRQTKRNPERGMSKVVLMIVVSFGVIAVVSIAAAKLLTPNLDKAHMAAAESSAIATVRRVNIGEITYDASFTGYASDLASLGPGPDGKCAGGSTPAHACMIGAEIGSPACTGTNWCTLGGYKFIIQGICVNGKCSDYVVTATPVDALSGSKNFCSTNDMDVRSETAPPKSSPFSLQQCQALPAMK